MNWWTRFCYRHQGSISIFLSIILLPFLWLIGVLVDTSNYNLSVASVEGAGELTANAALANYDTVLADVYGLFAMSQNVDDLKVNLEHYFQDSLDASGLMDGQEFDSESMQELNDQLMGVLDLTLSEEVTRSFVDVDYSDFTASGVEGSSLANPEILKSQIVEFMKYRGPAEIGMSLIDSLSVFKKVGEQSKVLKEKVNTDSEVASLAEESQKLYTAIVRLDKLIVEYLNEKNAFYGSNLDTIEGNLLAAETIIKDQLLAVANVADLAKIEQEEDERTAADGTTYHTYKIDDVSAKKLTNDYTLEDLRSDFSNWLNGFDGELSKVSGKVTVLDSLSGEDLNDAFEQYRTFMEYVKELYAYLITLEDKGEPETTDAAVIEEGWLLIDKAYVEIVAPFEEKAKSYDGELDAARAQVGRYVRSAVELLQQYRESAQNLADAKKTPEGFESLIKIFLQSAIDFTLDQVDKVGDAMDEVEAANNNLKQATERYEENTSSDDFSVGINSEVEQNSKNFSKQDLDELERQLKAIKKYIGDETDGEIARITYECKLFGTFMADFKMSGDDTKLGKDIVKKYTEYNKTPFFTLVDGEQEMTPDCFIKQIGTGTITLSNGQTVTPPPYYTYMACTYGEGDETSSKKSDDNLDASVENVNEMATENTEADAGLGTTGDKVSDSGILSGVPSGAVSGSDSTSFEELGEGNTAILGQLASMMTLVADMTQGMDEFLENGRDNLLVTQYVDSNFSCATTSKLSEPKDTMTNVAINPQNNPLYGCEMEYIIYGNKGQEARKFFFITLEDAPGPIINVSYAKNNILAIRFACNSIFAITNREINNLTLAPAMAIQSATLGVFPYKVAQIVLDVCLAYAESISDLNQLMKGKEVELIKTYNTWTMKPETLLSGDTVKAVAKEAIEEELEKPQLIITNNIQELIDNSKDSGANNIDEILLEINTSVTASVNSCTQSMKTLISDKLQTMLTESLQKGTVWTKEEVERLLRECTSDYLDSLENETIKEIASQTLEAILNDLLFETDELINKMNQKTTDAVQNCTLYIEKKISNALNGISAETNRIAENMAQDLQSEVNSLIDEAGEKLKDASEEEIAKISQKLSEDVSNTVNQKLNTYFPSNQQKIALDSGSDVKKNSGVGEFFKFSYQDYLRLFLFLKLNSDSDGVMLRIADMIQINMSQGMKQYGSEKLDGDGSTSPHPKGSEFQMSNAYTYVTIGANIKLNPLLLSQDLFNFTGDENSGAWTYYYQTTKGY